MKKKFVYNIFILFFVMIFSFVSSAIVYADNDSGGGGGTSFYDDDDFTIHNPVKTFCILYECSYAEPTFTGHIDFDDGYEGKPFFLYNPAERDEFKYTLLASSEAVSGNVSNLTFRGCKGVINCNLSTYYPNNDSTSDTNQDSNFENGTRGKTFVFNTSCSLNGIYTNIPIFNISDMNVIDNINNYILNDDTSGADNADDLIPEPEYSDSVELPQNLHVASGASYALKNNRLKKLTKDIVITWDQSEDIDTSNYQYDIDVQSYIDDISNDLDNIPSSIVSHSKNVNYSGSHNITVKLDTSFLNGIIEESMSHQHNIHVTGTPPSTCFVRKLVIRVRNKVGSDCSNFVYITVDFTDKSATASEKDSDGNTVDNAEYDNTDILHNNDDGGSSLSDIDSIVDFIKSGFGLFGSDGLVSLLSSFFGSIFPPMFWNLILLGIGIVILIGIINFLLKR